MTSDGIARVGAGPGSAGAALTVVGAPPLLLPQDLGRPGYRAAGVPAGGAMDRWALQLANVLAGNAPGTVALEWAAGGGVVHFSAATTFALAGADVEAALDGAPVDGHRALHARAGSELAVGRTRAGRWLYLAVRGGIDLPRVLGSGATYLPAALGGLEGRPLRAGDVLPIGVAPRTEPRAVACPAELRDPLPPAPGTVRVIRGPQAALLDDGGWAALLGATFTISRAADRTGYRLEGPAVPVAADAALPSDPGAPGAVQLPPGGQPIILMADAPTVGGYPKPAVVCSADLGRLAQCGTGERVRFVEIGIEEAQRLYRRRCVAVWTVGRL